MSNACSRPSTPWTQSSSNRISRTSRNGDALAAARASPRSPAFRIRAARRTRAIAPRSASGTADRARSRRPPTPRVRCSSPTRRRRAARSGAHGDLVAIRGRCDPLVASRSLTVPVAACRGRGVVVKGRAQGRSTDRSAGRWDVGPRSAPPSTVARTRCAMTSQHLARGGRATSRSVGDAPVQLDREIGPVGRHPFDGILQAVGAPYLEPVEGRREVCPHRLGTRDGSAERPGPASRPAAGLEGRERHRPGHPRSAS